MTTHIDIRDATIFAMFCVIVWALTRCADDGNRADVLPVPADAETPADNVTQLRWAS